MCDVISVCKILPRSRAHGASHVSSPTLSSGVLLVHLSLYTCWMLIWSSVLVLRAVCTVASLALDSGEETNFKRQKGNKIMITGFASPRKKQMHADGLFGKWPGGWWLQCCRSGSSRMGWQRLNWLQLARPWRECVGVSVAQWESFQGVLIMLSCYAGFKIMHGDWISGTNGTGDELEVYCWALGKVWGWLGSEWAWEKKQKLAIAGIEIRSQVWETENFDSVKVYILETKILHRIHQSISGCILQPLDWDGGVKGG